MGTVGVKAIVTKHMEPLTLDMDKSPTIGILFCSPLNKIVDQYMGFKFYHIMASKDT